LVLGILGILLNSTILFLSDLWRFRRMSHFRVPGRSAGSEALYFESAGPPCEACRGKVEAHSRLLGGDCGFHGTIQSRHFRRAAHTPTVWRLHSESVMVLL
jgi:hypothetical protein